MSVLEQNLGFIAKKKEKSRAEFACSFPPPFFTAGKPGYKRERAASEIIANQQWTAGSWWSTYDWIAAERGWHPKQTVDPQEHSENSIRTKYGFKTVLH